MKISDNGIALIKQEEGERLTAYRDPRGILTIGVGHTGPVDSRMIYPGQVITPAKSTALLLSDLAWVEKIIAGKITAPLTQNQYDALCCLIFNIGAGAFSTSVVRQRLNLGNYAGAADAFLMWKRAGTNKDILLARRQRERELFLS
ncbi:lysozyme [Pantoea sp. BAV 3049]|uniref:lysozyme n=1 Tax=Pantoea sp. BAV 3049 TaxID=2654188 RepID=UPI00131E24B2|nr:lysozyme [Pantoea sp. BAV 3049]